MGMMRTMNCVEVIAEALEKSVEEAVRELQHCMTSNPNFAACYQLQTPVYVLRHGVRYKLTEVELEEDELFVRHESDENIRLLELACDDALAVLRALPHSVRDYE